MNKLLCCFLPIAVLCTCKPGSGGKNSAITMPDSTVVRIAAEAHAFGLPLILMNISRRKFADKGSNPAAVAENTFRYFVLHPARTGKEIGCLHLPGSLIF
jgi:hypothetical protein